MLSTNGARAISALMVALLAGCAAPQPPQQDAEKLAPEVIVKTRTIDNSSKWFKPAYLEPTDVLGDQSAKVIIGNNEAGALHCGWKPPKK